MKFRRPSLQWLDEGSMVHCEATDAVDHSGGVVIDGMVTRTCQATGEALLIPMRNHRSQVGRITGDTGKAVEDERASEGSEVVMKRGNVRGAKGPCCL